MLHNLRTKKLPCYDVTISNKVCLLMPVSGCDSSGRSGSLSEFQYVDIAASLSCFRSSDFSIKNLESVGALGTLKTTYMSHMHNMNVADKFDNYSIPIPDEKS